MQTIQSDTFELPSTTGAVVPADHDVSGFLLWFAAIAAVALAGCITPCPPRERETRSNS